MIIHLAIKREKWSRIQCNLVSGESDLSAVEESLEVILNEISSLSTNLTEILVSGKLEILVSGQY